MDGLPGDPGPVGPVGPAGPGGVRGFREFMASPNLQEFVVPAGVEHLLVELWGGGGGGGQGQALEGGAGGGGGAYARLVIAVVPGETLFFSVGPGGASLAGNPGDPGEPTFVNNAAGFVASAFGGLGGSDTMAGIGGMCDLGGQPMALCRRGANGAFPEGMTGGVGGRAVFGSIEPIGSIGGRGANASPTLAAGTAGGNGYVLVSW